MSNSNADSSVEIYNRVNRLKIKAGGEAGGGPGKLAEENIAAANTVVQTMGSLYPKEIKKLLDHMNKDWVKIKDMPEEKGRKVQTKKLSNTANQIKDLAATYEYDLMAYFGESLRDYILESELQKSEQFTIVQAHIDVMNVSFKENIKNDDGGPVAEELKKVVAQAIEKHR